MNPKRVTRESVITYGKGGRPRGREILDQSYEELPQAFFSIDPEGCILYANDAWLRLFGLGRQDVLGKPFRGFLTRDGAETFRDGFRRCAEGHGLSSLEFKAVRKDRSEMVLSLDCRPVMDGKGGLQKAVATLRDVTDHKLAEAELAAVNRELKATERKMRADLVVLEESQHFTQKILKTLPTVVYIYNIDEGRNVYTSPDVTSWLGYASGAGDGNPLGAMEEAIHPEDLAAVREHLKKVAESADGEVLESEYRVRRADGGWQWFRSRDTVFTRRPDGSAKQIIGSASDITGLKNAEQELKAANQQLSATNQELKATEQQLKANISALRLSEEKFRNIVDCSPLGIHMYSLEDDGRLIFTGYNPAADNILRVDHGQFIGKTIEEAFPPLIQTEVPERYRQAARDGRPWHAENIEYKDGRIAGAFEVHAFQTSQGQMAAKFIDITRRVRLQEELDNIFNLTLDLVCIADIKDARFTKVNPAFNRVLGYSEEELLGRPFLEFVHPEDREATVKILRERLSRGEAVINFINRYACKDGSYRWLEWTSHPLPERGLTYAVARDITDRKLADAALRESEALFRHMADNAPMMIGVSDTEGRITYLSKTWLAFRGKTLEEEMGEGWARDLHPQDRDRTLGEIEEAVKGRRDYRLEYRILDAAGQYRWILDMAVPRYTDAGKFLGYVGSAVDITDHKNTGAELATKEERFRSVFQNSPLGIALSSPSDYRFVRANEMFCRMLGYSEEELASLTFKDITPPEFLHEDVENIRRLSEGEIPLYRTEKAYMRKDKSRIWASTTVSTIRGKDGKVANFLAMVEDISERKAAEAELASSEERLKILFEYAPDAIYLMDLEGVFSAGNKAAERLIGYDRSEIIGKNMAESGILPEDQFPKAADILGRNRRNEPSGPDELSLRRKDGGIIDVEMRTYPVKVMDGTMVMGIVRDVTERKKAQEALRESEENYRRIFQLSPESIFLIGVDGIISNVNDSACRRLGYAAGEILGRNIKDLAFLSDGSRAIVIDSFRRRMAGEELPPYEIGLTTKAGEILTVELVASPLYDGAGRIYGDLVMAIDITERKKNEEALRQSEEKYRSLFENAVIGVFKETADGKRFLDVNPAMTRLFGYGSPEEMVSAVSDIGSEIYADESQRQNVMAQILDGGGTLFRFENGYVRKDGSRFTGSLNIRIMRDSEGKPMYLEGFVEDITERKRAEEGIRLYTATLEQKVSERTAELQKANEEIRRLLETKSQFISQLSHDLRTPLTPMLALMPQISEHLTDQKDKERFEVVRRNVEYMKKLVTDTLNLARLESGTLLLEKSRVDLKRLAENLLADHWSEFEKAGMKASSDVQEGLAADADELRLKEVLDNIIVNSIKYSPKGGPLLMSANRAGGEIEYSVSDSGIGLEKDQLERIFLEFYKVDTSRHDLYSTGLGLAICKRIIEKHGGRIWAESEGLDKGTTIRFTLPAAD
jgi:PAS domain S-box-containing protein